MKQTVRKQTHIKRTIIFSNLVLTLLWAGVETASAYPKWTNTAISASGYWTNALNWDSGTVPLLASSVPVGIENAVFGTYTNILDYTLPYSTDYLNIQNTSGEAWLVVTNATLTENYVNFGLSIGTGGRLRIDASGVVTGAPAKIVMDGVGGQLYVNGGKLFTGAEYIGNASGASNNLILVSNGGLWKLGGTRLYIGNGAGANGNVLQITGTGSVVTNVDILNVGGNLTYPDCANSNSVVISNGGQLFASGLTSIGYHGEVGNQILVNNGTFSGNSPLQIGVSSVSGGGVGGGNQLAVTNGGYAHATDLCIGMYYDAGFSTSNNIVTVAGANAAGSNATLNVTGFIRLGDTGGGNNQLVIGQGGQVVAAKVNSGGWNNISVSGGNNVLVRDGGLLETSGDGSGYTLVTYAGTGGNTISNVGGIYQFTSASSQLYVSGGPIAITDGTISFRGITNANVNANQGAGFLATIAFNGANTFRLNAASNSTSSQTYTFGTGLGAKNYARLELLNGSCYQGGAVTNGNGGSLVVSNGTSTISSNLTCVAGSSLTVCVGTNAAGGALNVGGILALNGATLNLSLSHVPMANQPYVIITNPGAAPVGGMGTFAVNTVNVDFGGKTYRMSVHYNAGDGNDISVTYAALTGSLLMFQ